MRHCKFSARMQRVVCLIATRKEWQGVRQVSIGEKTRKQFHEVIKAGKVWWENGWSTVANRRSCWSVLPCTGKEASVSRQGRDWIRDARCYVGCGTRKRRRWNGWKDPRVKCEGNVA